MGRFKELVDTEEGMRNFRIKYNIPPMWALDTRPRANGTTKERQMKLSFL